MKLGTFPELDQAGAALKIQASFVLSCEKEPVIGNNGHQ